MTEQEAKALVLKLNKHFDKHVTICFKEHPFWGQITCAYSIVQRNEMYIVDSHYIHPEIITHEFTHFLELEPSGDHTPCFFDLQARVCSAVGIEQETHSIQECKEFTGRLEGRTQSN